MVIVEFHEIHHVSAVRTYQRIISEGRQYGDAPSVKTPVDLVFAVVDCPIKLRINLAMTGIKSSVSDHFVMLFRDMADESLYEIDCRYCLNDIFIIFVPVIVKRDVFTVIAVDSGSRDDGTSKISADVFNNCFRSA